MNSEIRSRTKRDILRWEGHTIVRRNSDKHIIAQLDSKGDIHSASTITDAKHPGYKRLSATTDIGGEMTLSKTNSIKAGSANFDLVSGTPPDGTTETFYGNYFPMSPSLMSHPVITMSSKEEIDEIGASAVASCAPGNSAFDAWGALGELYKDGLPKSTFDTMKPRSKKAHAAGSDYLNVMFGWKPLVNDVMNVADTISRAGSILDQLKRDSGRPVRRKLTVSDVVEDPTYHELGIGPPSVGMNSFNPAGYGKYWCMKEQTRTLKFSGSFCYYIPGNITSKNPIVKAASNANALFGIELTPSRLWNLAPWSWMADWFSNAGDVISNLERFTSGNLVMYYGYMTEYVVAKNTYYWQPMGGSTVGAPSPGAITFESVKAQRVQANPFGFGVSWNGLSLLQASILGALGVTRKA